MRADLAIKLLKKSIDLELQQVRVRTMYEIIGRYSERLSEDVVKEMYREAESAQKTIDRKIKSLE